MERAPIIIRSPIGNRVLSSRAKRALGRSQIWLYKFNSRVLIVQFMSRAARGSIDSMNIISEAIHEGGQSSGILKHLWGTDQLKRPLAFSGFLSSCFRLLQRPLSPRHGRQFFGAKSRRRASAFRRQVSRLPAPLRGLVRNRPPGRLQNASMPCKL